MIGATVIVRLRNPQSVVTFGGPALPRLHPDYYAAYVANYILGGGGFASRLTEEIREKRGLAYSVYSYLYDLDHAPLWLGGVATKNEQVAESIEPHPPGAAAAWPQGRVEEHGADRRQDLSHRLVPAAPDQQRPGRQDAGLRCSMSAWAATISSAATR